MWWENVPMLHPMSRKAPSSGTCAASFATSDLIFFSWRLSQPSRLRVGTNEMILLSTLSAILRGEFIIGGRGPMETGSEPAALAAGLTSQTVQEGVEGGAL